MRVALFIIALLHVLWAGVPLARRLLPGLALADAWVLGPATSLSLATWLLTWIGLLPGQPFAGWGPALVWAVVAGAGHLASRGGTRPDVSMPRETSAWAAWGLLAAFTAGAVYTALALPASHWDFLARYGRQALVFHGEGALSPAVHGYPPLVPVFGAAAYAALGEVHEGLAKLHAVVYLAALLALTARLAHRPRRPWVARVAVLSFGLAPIVLNAPPCGDPDLALTFHATACLWLLLHESADAPVRLAVACGLQLGLALWAKQAAAPFAATLVVLGALSAAGWLAHGWLSAPRLALALAVAGALAAPWYLRNLALTGQLSELTNVADALAGDRSVASLALVRWYEELGPAGTPLFMLGLVGLPIAALAPAPGRPALSSRWLAVLCLALAGAALVIRVPPFDRHALIFGALAGGLLLVPRAIGLEPRATIACAFVLPLLLVWWARFAFTARYVVPVLPALAAAGAAAAARAFGPLFRRAPAAWALALPALALATFDAAPVYRATLAQAFHARGLTREECFARVYPGAVYRVARRLKAEAPGARVATNDSRLGYFLDPARPPGLLPRDGAALAGVDVIVHGPWGDGMFASPAEIAASRARIRALAGEPWFTDGGYDVHRVRR